MRGGPKIYCDGKWSAARFANFIKSALRNASSRWGPKYTCLKNARVSRGLYQCALCPSIVGPKEIKADHIEPVVSVETGFVNWDTYIKRLFVEAVGFQALCTVCHAEKSLKENALRHVSV